jgi:bis(5'-nucleosyl)-tetraphosphatase (symmetrical)
MEFKGPRAEVPPGRFPWFEVPGRASVGATIVFGHWASLGLCLEPGVVGLDSACVWGGELTAIRLEDRALFQQPRVD